MNSKTQAREIIYIEDVFVFKYQYSLWINFYTNETVYRTLYTCIYIQMFVE